MERRWLDFPTNAVFSFINDIFHFAFHALSCGIRKMDLDSGGLGWVALLNGRWLRETNQEGNGSPRPPNFPPYSWT